MGRYMAHSEFVDGLKVGYAKVSTVEQDLFRAA